MVSISDQRIRFLFFGRCFKYDDAECEYSEVINELHLGVTLGVEATFLPVSLFALCVRYFQFAKIYSILLISTLRPTLEETILWNCGNIV